MKISADEIVQGKKFDIFGMSYIGRPKSNTAMYISKKVESLLENLSDVRECLVFAETGISPSVDLMERHAFSFSDKPQTEYTRFADRFFEERFKEEQQLKYKQTEGGFYVTEDVVIPSDAYIEPGCIIGPSVRIGNHARILAGTIIKHTIIGDYFLANQYAVIGANGFTMTDDEEGNKVRIPTLGDVRIGNYVEIGSHDNISCGSGGDTILNDYVKLDSLVHVGHDVNIGKNTEIASGTVLGGFAEIGEDVFIGINSTVRNRIKIGNGAFISMGSAVMKSVEDGYKVVGNPARGLPQ